MHTHFVKGTVIIPNTAVAGAAAHDLNKKSTFENCALFANCITQISNTQVNYVDVVMPIYNLIKYSDIYLKTLGDLCQYYRD